MYEYGAALFTLLLALEVVFWLFVGSKVVNIFRTLIGSNKE